MRRDELQLKPENVTIEEAAGVGAAASTVLHGLRDAGQIRAGQRIAVNGASGGVGTFAVQLGKAFGADVTGVCGATNLDLVCSLGADQAVDYGRDDFALTERPYDLIFDCAANRRFSDCRHALTANGRYVTTAFSPGLALQGKATSLKGGKRMVALAPRPPDKKDWTVLNALLETGRIKTVIDRCFELAELPEALVYLEARHTRGKLIIVM